MYCSGYRTEKDLTIGCTATDFPPLRGSKPTCEPDVMFCFSNIHVRMFIMSIKYKYIKAGTVTNGEISSLKAETDHHEIVQTVLKEIANKEGERIVTAMMSTYIEGQQVGVNHFDPGGAEPSTLRTIEKIEICSDGETWNTVSLIEP
jgi:hypothetical protein